jgi:hypothetical protein
MIGIGSEDIGAQRIGLALPPRAVVLDRLQ